MSWQDPHHPEVRLTHRALRFIKAPCEAALSASVIVGISHRNQPEHLLRALRSVARQDMPAGSVACLVLDDSSESGWLSKIDSANDLPPLLVIAAGRMGSPAQARNALLDLVDEHFPDARWVARLDADDELVQPDSLRRMVEAGERRACLYVVGSNRLRLNGETLSVANRAEEATLLDRFALLNYIEAFCHQRIDNELPSCNLLLRTHSGIRYPNARSAEDHWLLAALLMHRPNDGAVVSAPFYAVYNLSGNATEGSKVNDFWIQSRHALAAATSVWYDVLVSGAKVLGWGQEGVVFESGGRVIKRFYPEAITEQELRVIGKWTRQTSGAIIGFRVVDPQADCACICLDDLNLSPVIGRIPDGAMERFLVRLYRSGVVACNIKRDNLMQLPDGELVYIDIGRDIVDLTASRFLDCAARLFAVGHMGWSDHELARRKTRDTQVMALSCLHGFEAFYRKTVEVATGIKQAVEDRSSYPAPRFVHDDVTLMLKACPQDWESLELQTMHIVGELRDTAQFCKVVLVIDPYSGPYLRQYCSGDLSALRDAADQLVESGWLDAVWVADQRPELVAQTYAKWFGLSQSSQTHTSSNAPLFAQLWAFDQVETRYVLQVDVDVLVCLKDQRHDVVADMKFAMSDPTVWCVGFNIPQSIDGVSPYHGEPQKFAPEVRFGLLDLCRIRSRRPFSNPVVEGRYQLMWHRMLQAAQDEMGMRSVRGGDSRSCYVHPPNAVKNDERLAVARDLFSQGLVPQEQRDHWDLVAGEHWAYPRRTEDIVILALGRDTPPAKLARLMQSLKQQSRQDFGVILVEDGGLAGSTLGFHRRHEWLDRRLTLIRRPNGVGYLENFQECVQKVCARPETMIVVVDQDDALMGHDIVDRLWRVWRDGADLINAPMFRLDKPTQLYPVDYVAPRQKGGGNVWAHLRAFRKSLYEKVPDNCWLLAPDSMCLSDYITMVPMAELARQPVYMDGPYAYLHDRQPYDQERKQREELVKSWLFSQPELHLSATGETFAAEQSVAFQREG